ncbi:sigma-54 interaction domain-containing protein [Piscinibacter terrae]|uniref:Sigma-54-dependent Fis family transcriptional regulator n=1 Tax=Piscinibacter terrae TaxID=2496871 RepID=A0A3N7HTT7_9BURK|nr:sigma-54 dependent transcriptional regulator [Albitalea terrae]RQP25738.1 sigma-54-dependent Fis family transcriptional regulator [Albitalea terrae]
MAAADAAPDFLCQDPAWSSLLDRLDRIARSQAVVLVNGETGTGKEVIARHIHARSARKGPFVAVNCGALSESLIDAELFGHESGAFTGASRSRAGWFEEAAGGTLLLDEIGELSLHLQVKLLRVLQERQVVRLGSRKPVALDVRLVAATHVDLAEAVKAQRFRADLYYRLNVAPVRLPALRNRRGDILPLARHFMDQYGAQLGLTAVALADDARQALLAHPWPGNVRELENAIHRAMITCDGEVLRADDLCLDHAGCEAPVPAPAAAAAPAVSPEAEDNAGEDHALVRVIRRLLSVNAPSLFTSVESTLVQEAYARCSGNQVHTAKLLGIPRHALRTLLKRHCLL